MATPQLPLAAAHSPPPARPCPLGPPLAALLHHVHKHPLSAPVGQPADVHSHGGVVVGGTGGLVTGHSLVASPALAAPAKAAAILAARLAAILASSCTRSAVGPTAVRLAAPGTPPPVHVTAAGAVWCAAAVAVALAVCLAGWACEAWVAGAHACLQAGAGPGAVAGAVKQGTCRAVVLLLAGAAPGAGGALQGGHVAKALQTGVEGIESSCVETAAATQHHQAHITEPSTSSRTAPGKHGGKQLSSAGHLRTIIVMVALCRPSWTPSLCT